MPKIALLLLSCVFAVSSHSLDINDSLPAELQKQLKLEPNKITIVDFFASWCASCRIELPLISELAPSLNTEAVEIVGINVDEEIEEGQAYIDTFKETGGLNFRIIMDPEQQLIEAFEPLGIPALYFIQNGVVKALHLGAVPNIDRVIVNDLKQLGYQPQVAAN